MLKILPIIGFLAIIPVVALAQTDPHVGVTEDGLGPLPVSVDLDDVQPDSTSCIANDGNCSFIFYNDASGIIDAFTFDTSFSASSFTPPPDETYTCSSGYFLNCSATLTLNDGTYYLDYSFSGVDPTSDGNPYENGNPNGLPEGIAPGDVFYVSLGGWTGGFQTVTLTNTFNVPEASSVLILFTELLLFAGLAWLLGLRRNRFASDASVDSDQQRS